MRVPLEGGQSATLRERLTYAQAHLIRAAYFAAEGNPAGKADIDLALVRAYVSSWDVLDLDSRAISLETPELAPDDAIQEIAKAAADLFGLTKVAVPKAEGDSSPSTLPEPPSDSVTTLSWPMPSSSTSTPDGPGPT